MGFEVKEAPLAFSMTGMLSPFLEVGMMECFILDDGLLLDPSGDDETWAITEDPLITFSVVPIRRSGGASEVLGVKTRRIVGPWI